ncbi:hypothetical protein [Micromonospora yangpuensis]|uniref:HEAT repeat-containing protein n=1 Tax=Micromonospora yangpuensis TaxID=683228 RepID=A0A1C6UIW3_9ACTN|nr:hypothetical protein [Micromonospora yangpuensis]GGM02867.1 hypothetical protein GCM10012279_20580 [Micromonospora yangpuensis]SCL54006.1 hypothetical protein GA0070617_2534 [Micromonospora yangpuensis]
MNVGDEYGVPSGPDLAPRAEPAVDSGIETEREVGPADLPPVRQTAGSSDEEPPADQPEEQLDPTDVLTRLSSLLGASAIEVGDVRVRGQNATGPGATAIGTVNITTAVSSDGGRTWSETLSAEWVGALAAGYAPAPSDEQLDHQLKQRRLVCLSGTAGSGRYTAACLASARHHGLDRVGVLGAEHLADLLRSEAPVRGGYGYVLLLDETAVRNLDGMTLIGLAARVESGGATLILVSEFDRNHHELAGRLVEHRAPAAADVFQAQLRHRLRDRCVGRCPDGCRGACVNAYLEQRLLRHPLLAAHLAGGCRTSEAVRLAELLAPHVNVDTDLTEWLGRWLPRQLRDRAARILALEDRSTEVATVADPDQRRAFRLTCAVLAGQPVAELHAAARRLTGAHGTGLPDARQPTALGQPDAGAPHVGSLGPGIEALLGPSLGQVVQLVDDDRPGGRRIEFTTGNEQLRASLLEVAWSDWWLPEQLLGWLAELVRSDSGGVRQAAAGAIGWSARHGLRTALETVDQLARERRAGVRQAAAIALVAMAMQPQLRLQIRTELDRWAAGGPAHLRDTVARAYALGLARIWPDAALVQLRLVAQARMQRWHNSVVRGLVEVYVAGHAASVLPALAQWATSDHPEVRLHAGRALRVLADRAADAPREHWPELLELARNGRIRMDDLATCWVAALSIPQTAYRAWRTLGFWLSRAEGRAELSHFLLELLRQVVSGERPLRRRLAHQLDHVWAAQLPHDAFLAEIRRLTYEGQ